MKNRLVYGTAKLSNLQYGYGSKPKNFNKKNFLKKFLFKKFSSFEVSDRYYKSILLFTKNSKIEIHYKIDEIPSNKDEIENHINKKIFKFLKLTKRKYIDVLYLHQNNIKILSNKVIINHLKSLRKKKLVKNFGASIYTEKELKYVLNQSIYNFIQIPVNITDTYLLNKFKMQLRKKVVVARSIFLQGTLLNKIVHHKERKKIKDYLGLIKDICSNNVVDFNKVLISFVFNIKYINKIILGSVNKDNITKILRLSNFKISKSLMKKIYKQSNKQKKWNNPKNW